MHQLYAFAHAADGASAAAASALVELLHAQQQAVARLA